jgi:hypothetical protein
VFGEREREQLPAQAFDTEQEENARHLWKAFDAEEYEPPRSHYLGEEEESEVPSAYSNSPVG